MYQSPSMVEIHAVCAAAYFDSIPSTLVMQACFGIFSIIRKLKIDIIFVYLTQDDKYPAMSPLSLNKLCA